MARLGELDCDRLHEGALRYLAEMRGTATPAPHRGAHSQAPPWSVKPWSGPALPHG
jgi:hypothetical protein